MSTTADDRDASRDAGYVLTLDEIRDLAKEAGKPAETLMNVVALIASRFHSDVCSAYLLEPDRATLVLAATIGLRHECIGTLRMELGGVFPGNGPNFYDQLNMTNPTAATNVSFAHIAIISRQSITFAPTCPALSTSSL